LGWRIFVLRMLCRRACEVYCVDVVLTAHVRRFLRV
jgi:hypothetical protein